MRWCLLCALLAVSCGDSPTTPTVPPAPPPPLPIPMPVARLVADNETLSGFPRADGSWTMSATVINIGPDCADQVRGTLTIVLGTERFYLDWALPEDRILRVNERIRYEACCLPARDYRGSGDGTYYTAFTVHPILCP